MTRRRRASGERSDGRTIRRAGSADLGLVQRISADAFLPYETTLGIVPLPVHEDYGPRIARGEVWLMEVRSEIVGLVVLEGAANHLLLYSLAVRPDRQGQGHGRALLDFAERHALEAGVREVRLYTNQRMERNIALYERCGYVQTGTRPHPRRAGHVVVDMAKRLPARPLR